MINSEELAELKPRPSDAEIQKEFIEFHTWDIPDMKFTRLEFLKPIYGPRRKCLHLIFGDTGSGKTTVTRAIVSEIAKHERVLVWTTEENATTWSIGTDNNIPVNNLLFCEELNLVAENEIGYFNILKQKIFESNCQWLVFDNITTSKMYDTLTPGRQSAFMSSFAKLCKSEGFEIGVFIVAHTVKNFKSSESVIQTSDIRGSSSVGNMCEIIYGVQGVRFDLNGKLHYAQILSLVKTRFHTVTDDNKYYQTVYSAQYRAITSARLLEYKEANEIFASRTKLGTKKGDKNDKSFYKAY